MKTILLTLSVLLVGWLSASSQGIVTSWVLDSIEANNTLLRALRSESEASKLQNLAGLTLADPEVEFSYMWGQPSDVPNKINVGVSQSFDFATLSGAKKRVANRQNCIVESDYQQTRLAVLLEAEQTLADLTYYNALIRLYDERIAHLNNHSELLHEALQRGETNIIDVNTADLELKSMTANRRMAEIERDASLSSLIRLNGGKEIIFTNSEMCIIDTSKSFEQWYAEAEQHNPMLGSLRTAIELSKEELSLSKSEGLPSFSVGYINELVKGSNYHGVSVGLSVPLWSNRGKVKAAKASLNASQIRLEDAQMQFYAELQSQYSRVQSLAKLAKDYNDALSRLNNKAALDKALNAGQISVIDYIQEMRLYYDVKTKLMEAQRDLAKAYASLSIYTR